MLLDIVTNRTPPPLGAIFFFEANFEHCQTRCMCDYQVFKDRTVTLRSTKLHCDSGLRPESNYQRRQVNGLP